MIVSKIKLRLTISVGEKSRVPLGVDGLMDAMRQMYKKAQPRPTLLVILNGVQHYLLSDSEKSSKNCAAALHIEEDSSLRSE